MRDREPKERDRAYERHDLCQQDDLAPIIGIGDRTNDGREQELRHKSRQADEAQLERRAGDLEDLPGNCGLKHGPAGAGEKATAGIEAEVGILEDDPGVGACLMVGRQRRSLAVKDVPGILARSPLVGPDFEGAKTPRLRRCRSASNSSTEMTIPSAEVVLTWDSRPVFAGREVCCRAAPDRVREQGRFRMAGRFEPSSGGGQQAPSVRDDRGYVRNTLESRGLESRRRKKIAGRGIEPPTRGL